jgi:hypothetical protein
MTLNDWLLLVFTGVAGMFGLFCLFDGARRLAAHGVNSSGRQMIGVGLAICVMLSGYSLWKHRLLTDISRAYQPATAGQELPDDWHKKTSPAKREAESLALARVLYVQTGLLKEHFDVRGQRKRFTPAQDDVKQREVAIAKAAQVEHEARTTFVDFVMWLVWGATALLFGPLFAREPVAKPAESAADA